MNVKLEGVRIWLAASIHHDAADEEGQRILAFVEAFANAVFRSGGGRLIHGSQPEIRKTLLDTAGEFKKNSDDKAGLVMIVSRHFSKEPEKHGIELDRWNGLCAEKVIETREAIPEQGQSPTQEASLEYMRKVLADQCNVLVSVGGRWWDTSLAKAGIPKEIDLAVERQMPCFLLGGLGGATRSYLNDNPELLRKCNNGWRPEKNTEVAEMQDPASLAAEIVDQISRLPVRYRSPHSGRPFRILCLDGGGMRGAFSAAALAYWEKKSGRRIAEHFDLVAGTSTGGLLAIGLGLGKTAAEMLEFYRTEGVKIFGADSGTQKWWHSFRHWFGAKYDGVALKNALEAAYSGKTLDDSICRLVIPVYNETSDLPEVCRTPHPPFERTHANGDPVQTARATAAAPTYFEPIELKNAVATIKAVDGGVWANCPATVALAEAVGKLGVPIERIDMLSIGTTYTTDLMSHPLLLDKRTIGELVKAAGGIFSKPIGWLASLTAKAVWRDRQIRGKIGYVANIAGFLMKAQGQTADHVCQGLLV